jgi:hypothetical protein
MLCFIFGRIAHGTADMVSAWERNYRTLLLRHLASPSSGRTTHSARRRFQSLPPPALGERSHRCLAAFSLGGAICLSGALLCEHCIELRGENPWELGKAHHVILPMTNRDFDGRSGFRHYGRWSFPWRPEDDWGPITAAVALLVMLLVILSELIYSGLTV